MSRPLKFAALPERLTLRLHRPTHPAIKPRGAILDGKCLVAITTPEFAAALVERYNAHEELCAARLEHDRLVVRAVAAETANLVINKHKEGLILACEIFAEAADRFGLYGKVPGEWIPLRDAAANIRRKAFENARETKKTCVVCCGRGDRGGLMSPCEACGGTGQIGGA